MVVVAVAAVLAALSGTAAQAGDGVPEPVGPWGYTYGIALTGVDGDCRFYRVALGNGVAEELGRGLPCVDGLTFSPAGVLYGFTVPAANGPMASELVTIDPTTGAIDVVGSFGGLVDEGGMTFDRDGRLWLYANGGDDLDCAFSACLYEVNPETGELTTVGGQEQVFVTGLAASCSTVYGIGFAGRGLAATTFVTVDTSDGQVEVVGNTGLQFDAQGLDFAADGTLYTLGRQILMGPVPVPPKAAVVDPATGQGSDVVDWISDDPTPATVFGLAIAGLTCAEPAPAPAVLEPTFTG